MSFKSSLNYGHETRSSHGKSSGDRNSAEPGKTQSKSGYDHQASYSEDVSQEPSSETLWALVSEIQQDIIMVRDKLYQYQKKKQQKLSGRWLTSRMVMNKLHISKRKLAYMRKNKEITFTNFKGTFYYKNEDIEQVLLTNYNKSNSEKNVAPA